MIKKAEHLLGSLLQGYIIVVMMPMSQQKQLSQSC